MWGGAAEPIRVGLIAPLSGGSAASGEAIQRGMLLAVDEINRAGGVLSRPMEVVARDVQNDPAAGVAALRELVREQEIVAVFGGSFSPVMIGQLDALHELEVPLINPWGSVTRITQNGRELNYAFRVSASDDTADEFLVRYALEQVGVRHPAIIADTYAWGESNTVGLRQWIERSGATLAGVARFDQGETNMTHLLERLRASNADALLMVANAPEGAAIMRGRAVLGWQVPVISHWGITGGPFVERAGVDNAEGVLTLQTYSFLPPPTPSGEELARRYHARFGTRSAEEIAAPVGVAHGYDGMHILARALRQAGSAEGPRVREALENPREPYDGVLKRYDPAFTRDRHDALVAGDYLMAVWRNGRLVLADPPRLQQNDQAQVPPGR